MELNANATAANGAAPGKLDALKKAASDPRIKDYALTAGKVVVGVAGVGVALGVINAIAGKTYAVLS